MSFGGNEQIMSRDRAFQAFLCHDTQKIKTPDMEKRQGGPPAVTAPLQRAESFNVPEAPHFPLNQPSQQPAHPLPTHCPGASARG